MMPGRSCHAQPLNCLCDTHPPALEPGRKIITIRLCIVSRDPATTDLPTGNSGHVSVGSRESGPRSGGREFGELQQHIDELTQQKFELARAAEGQRRVAETLSSENEALTDSYNRQVRGAAAAGKPGFVHSFLENDR